MKWRCALIQRWLPAHLEGDLSSFWNRRFGSHLEHCDGCRREQEALEKVVAALKAAPVSEPEPEFWGEFSRELHLKLAHAAHDGRQAPAAAGRSWRARLPYLVGAPGLAVLALWVITTYTNPQRAIMAPQSQRAQTPVMEKAGESLPPKMAEMPRAKTAGPSRMVEAPREKMAEPSRMMAAPSAAPSEPLVYATVHGTDASPEEDDDLDLSTSGLDSVLAGMSDQEKERFLHRLHQKKKDGSWLERLSPAPLA